MQKVNPSRLPVVVGGLLDVDCSEDIIKVRETPLIPSLLFTSFPLLLICSLYHCTVMWPELLIRIHFQFLYSVCGSGSRSEKF